MLGSSSPSLKQCLEGVSCPGLHPQNVISLPNNEHLLSYPEKLRLCHGAVCTKQDIPLSCVQGTKSDSFWGWGRTMVGYGGDK